MRYVAFRSPENWYADKLQTLRIVLADFASLQNLLQEAATKTSEKNAEAAAAQAKELTNVHELAIAATRALENMQTDSLAQVCICPPG